HRGTLPDRFKQGRHGSKTNRHIRRSVAGDPSHRLRQRHRRAHPPAAEEIIGRTRWRRCEQRDRGFIAQWWPLRGSYVIGPLHLAPWVSSWIAKRRRTLPLWPLR